MAILKTTLLVIVLLALAVGLAAQLGLLRGRTPSDLGARDGRLKPPSTTPNSVSSQAALYPDNPQRAYAAIAPFPASEGGPQTLERIRRVCEGMPGAKVAKSDPGYLHVQFETRWMKFVDDTEFWFDPRAGLIHVRSASRMGRKDFGVNRARVEAIRARLEAR
ncbi:DUF1499 domain-containing protein [Piscinibacter sp.]|uniref:DUF1499 domain-containing protein n=1 Tax=Piscinibacter sp. TaxID=1903157 RepID=UPI001B4A43AD|nr:DUF1499 domain-containing protein [Piscinibacter sp.]MBK7529346.1 DUF1499 domain-containing protein [Piscinibacter sp.]MBP6541611.1 DUF1499 domain-containing protein [Piscinibacter sp.]